MNAALKVLKEIDLNLNIVALAKKEELLFLPFQALPVILPKNSQAFYLVQRIRDEAHRFAVTYHKKLRQKTIKHSIVDFIPGIGEKRKINLLKQFKSIERIKQADVKEIAEIPGIGKKTAQKIKDVLEVRI